MLHFCRYFTAGGSPDTAVDLLSSNYSALAQLANFLAELQIMAGIDIKEVQDVVENHLKLMIIKYFDPKRADSIFTDEGEVGRQTTLIMLTKNVRFFSLLLG